MSDDPIERHFKTEGTVESYDDDRKLSSNNASEVRRSISPTIKQQRIRSSANKILNCNQTKVAVIYVGADNVPLGEHNTTNAIHHKGCTGDLSRNQGPALQSPLHILESTVMHVSSDGAHLDELMQGAQMTTDNSVILVERGGPATSGDLAS